MVGILQSGVVLHVRGVSHSGERALVFKTLRQLTSEAIPNSAAAWRKWLSKRGDDQVHTR